MSAAGSSVFTDADGYQANLRDMLDLLVLSPRHFHARLTWVDLPHVRLLRAEESAARVAYLRLPSEQVFVFFATKQSSRLLHDGEELQFGDLHCYGRSGAGHQRTTGTSQWGLMAVNHDSLASFGRSLIGSPLHAPSCTSTFHPGVAESRQLLRLHARATRIAETSPRSIANAEIVRSLDQDLMALLVSCLSTENASLGGPARERWSRLCVEFEQLISTQPFRIWSTSELCGALRVSEKRLRASCRRLLGMSPGRYQRLRRLKLVRAELRRAGMEGLDVPTIMARHGFATLPRFIAEYWQIYGEMPPIPARAATRR